MHFNLYNWLFTDPYDAGINAGLSGAEKFHYLWPWLIFCCAGLLIVFYYFVEGRKRFVKNKPVIKYMLDRYLGWFAVVCFIGLPLIFSRVYLDQFFFAWRVWRYLWLLGMVIWGLLWLRHLVFKYPQERASYLAYQNRKQYMPRSKSKRKAKAASR
jgi:hypothetical protein